ncbi:MAG TPA: methyltransferase domain-containing protein [Acidobacteriota bacterium]|nr:methyltransferase domain-containing protein [Acidobacteriota bacterium]
MSHPSRPEFWNERYARGTTPWDYGGVPPQLQRYLTAHPNGGRALIPGCGAGHEIAAFYEAGYEVAAIDFATAAVERARANLGPVLAERVFLGDFFTYDFAAAPFDVVYERTFLCALPPDLRPQYVNRMARLLAPGGVLVGLFYLGEEQGGPPYQLHAADEAQLFGPHFVLVQDQAAAEPFPLFGDNERWREYRRIK